MPISRSVPTTAALPSLEVHGGIRTRLCARELPKRPVVVRPMNAVNFKITNSPELGTSGFRRSQPRRTCNAQNLSHVAAQNPSKLLPSGGLRSAEKWRYVTVRGKSEAVSSARFRHRCRSNSEGSEARSEGEGEEVKEKKGTIFGAMALIIGTCVGAGILALPAETAPAGFVPSASALGACWAFLTLEAFLLVEVNVALLRRREKNGNLPHAHSEVISLSTMAEETLGSVGGALATVAYLFVSFTLLVAYISKTAEVLSLVTSAPVWAMALLFTFGFGGLLFRGSMETTDKISQVLTSALLTLFAIIVVGGCTIADWSELSRSDWSNTPHVLPIVFLSLVYHDLVPVVCAYLGGDIDRIRKSIILGSLVPLSMFLLWDAVALSLSHVSGYEDPLQILMSSGGSVEAATIQSFALLATVTSFLGTAVGLSEYVTEQLGNFASSVATELNGKPQAGARPRVESSEGEERGVSESGKLWGEGDGKFERPVLISQMPKITERSRHHNSPIGLEELIHRRRQATAKTVAIRAGERGSGSQTLAECVAEGFALEMKKWKEGGVAKVVKSMQLWYAEAVDKISAVAVESLVGREGECREASVQKDRFKTVSFLVVLTPPVIIALTTPDAFFAACDAAGAYGMTTLYGVFPPAMAWGLHQLQVKSSQEATDSSYKESILRVPGGNVALASMGFCASAIIFSQVALSAAEMGPREGELVVLAEAVEGGGLEVAQSLVSLARATDADPPFIL